MIAEYSDESTADITETANLDVDGTAVSLDNGAVVANEEGTAELTVQYSEEGTSLNDSVTVDVDAEEDTLVGMPGFTMTVALLGLLLTVGYILRRR